MIKTIRNTAKHAQVHKGSAFFQASRAKIGLFLQKSYAKLAEMEKR